MDEKLENVSNSHKVRDGNAKKETKVTPPQRRGKVKVKKKNGFEKFVEAFLPEDVTDVKSYILSSVFVPMLKKFLEDGFHAILYGTTNVPPSGRRSSRASYSDYYGRSSSSSSSRKSRERGDYSLDGDYAFEYEEDLEDFVRWMHEMIEENGIVRLSEADEEFGRTGYWTNMHYGWTSISGWRSIDTRRPGEGRFVLKLPRPFPID